MRPSPASALRRTAVIAFSAVAVAALSLPVARAYEGGPPELVFVSDRDGDDEIYFRAADGRVRQLTRNTAADYFPVWSPDGRRIAFVSNRDGDDDIYVMRADGSGVRHLTRNGTTPDGAPIADVTPAWSPDGSQIAFASNRTGGFAEIWVMAADGTRPVRLTRTAALVDDSTPAWSPDGRLIAFVSNRAGNDTSDLYVMRRDGTGVRALTDTGDTADSTLPEWSPDGRLIAYTTNVTRGQQDIWAVDPQGRNPRAVGGHPRYDDVMPRWTSDGRQIVYWTFHYLLPGVEERSADVWVMDRDGGNRRAVVASGAEDSTPDPRPR